MIKLPQQTPSGLNVMVKVMLTDVKKSGSPCVFSYLTWSVQHPYIHTTAAAFSKSQEFSSEFV